MSNFVRLLKSEFAGLVERGEKRQTIRQTPKRMPRADDEISLRAWTGKAYRSQQRVLGHGVITAVWPIAIRLGDTGTPLISVGGGVISDEEAFARADGFPSVKAMCSWFDEQHGLPFSGIVICWQIKPPPP